MTAVQAVLSTLHPILDQMLDSQTHQILERTRFHHLHLVYMNLATCQWVAGLLHMLLALLIWSWCDKALKGPHEAATGAILPLPNAGRPR